MDATAPVQTNPVVELRQYTLHPGQREALIDLFDRLFVDGQEAVGIRVLGEFRDLDKPDRFVWMRGFRDMPSRARALQDFYGGPLWKAHRDQANATMVDSDNVLLLHPVDAQSGLVPSPSGPASSTSLILATVYLLHASAAGDFARFFESRVSPEMVTTGAKPLARFETELARNNFPGLPVREGEHAFVWLAAFASAADIELHRAELQRSKAWTQSVKPDLERRLHSPIEELRLAPTPRSRLGQGPLRPFTPLRTGGVHDFDFLIGEWRVANRRLKKRGVGSQDWEAFPATSRATSHLGGGVNVDEISFTTQGWSGMTFRIFNPERKQWSIYWISERTGTLFPPVMGGFQGERGEFFGEDEDDGHPVKVRYLWTKLGPDAAHWEQAFSTDGRTWETNWIMELRRLA